MAVEPSGGYVSREKQLVELQVSGGREVGKVGGEREGRREREGGEREGGRREGGRREGGREERGREERGREGGRKKVGGRNIIC